MTEKITKNMSNKLKLEARNTYGHTPSTMEVIIQILEALLR